VEVSPVQRRLGVSTTGSCEAGRSSKQTLQTKYEHPFVHPLQRPRRSPGVAASRLLHQTSREWRHLVKPWWSRTAVAGLALAIALVGAALGIGISGTQTQTRVDSSFGWVGYAPLTNSGGPPASAMHACHLTSGKLPNSTELSWLSLVIKPSSGSWVRIRFSDPAWQSIHLASLTQSLRASAHRLERCEFSRRCVGRCDYVCSRGSG
jgi:hypothetical protein